MYSFQPLADIPVDHFGFGLLVTVAVFIALVIIFNEPELFFGWFFVATMVCSAAYYVSYHWCDQTPQTFKNEKVMGEFVKYESEGYRERSGKSMVDRHFTYVVYKVPEGNIMLPCVVGVPYPKTAILYKN